VAHLSTPDVPLPRRPSNERDHYEPKPVKEQQRGVHFAGSIGFCFMAPVLAGRDRQPAHPPRSSTVAVKPGQADTRGLILAVGPVFAPRIVTYEDLAFFKLTATLIGFYGKE
jgi:hypothetical protein